MSISIILLTIINEPINKLIHMVILICGLHSFSLSQTGLVYITRICGIVIEGLAIKELQEFN